MSYNGIFKFSNQRLVKELDMFPKEAMLTGITASTLFLTGIGLIATSIKTRNPVLGVISALTTVLTISSFIMYTTQRRETIERHLGQELTGLIAFLREENVELISVQDHPFSILPTNDITPLRELLYELAFPADIKGNTSRGIRIKTADGKTKSTFMIKETNGWSLYK